MFQKIVVTVGTSLFSTNNYFYESIVSQQQFHFQRNQLSAINQPFSEQAATQQFLHSIDVPFFLKNWRSLPISAEFTALQALADDQLAPNVVIELFYTNSLAGRVVSATLQYLMEVALQANVERVAIEPFDVKSKIETNEAMGKFLVSLYKRLVAKRDTTCFIPIGGYKVLTSTAYIAGALAKVPVHYIPEGGRSLHTLPIVPITLHKNERLLQLLYKIHAHDLPSFTAEEKALVQHDCYYLLQDGAQMRLNPLGYFLLMMDKEGE